MRDIKFRAWFTDGKNKTLPGQIHSMQEDRTLLEFLQDIEDCKEEHGYNVILEQYTGLNDKHGKPIYEGDIVRHTIHKTDGSRTWDEVEEYEIKWEFVGFKLKGGFSPGVGRSKTMEIIVTIHTAPQNGLKE